MFFKKFVSILIRTVFTIIILLTIANCHFGPPKQASDKEFDNLPQENKLTAKVYIDDKFSGIERQNVIKGLRDWENATNGTIKFNVTNRGNWNSDDNFIDIPQPDPETRLTSCTKDIYIARAHSNDKIVTDLENSIKEQTNLEITIAGYTNLSCQIKWIIIVADRIEDNEQYVTVTIHEMGHMLGLRHVKLEDLTIMYPGLPSCTTCITQIDTDQFCNKWNCDRTKMKPCLP